MITKERLDTITELISVYKEGQRDLQQNIQLYNGFVQALEGSLKLYADTIDPKTHNPLNIIGLYMGREELKSGVEKLMGEFRNGPLLVKSKDREYKISLKDFDDIAELLNESDANIGRLYNMYYPGIENVGSIISEMGKYKGKY